MKGGGSISTLLFYGGLSAAGFALVTSLAAAITLKLSRKYLLVRLDMEYGKDRNKKGR